MQLKWALVSGFNGLVNFGEQLWIGFCRAREIPPVLVRRPSFLLSDLIAPQTILRWLCQASHLFVGAGESRVDGGALIIAGHGQGFGDQLSPVQIIQVIIERQRITLFDLANGLLPAFDESLQTALYDVFSATSFA